MEVWRDIWEAILLSTIMFTSSAENKWLYSCSKDHGTRCVTLLRIKIHLHRDNGCKPRSTMFTLVEKGLVEVYNIITLCRDWTTVTLLNCVGYLCLEIGTLFPCGFKLKTRKCDYWWFYHHIRTSIYS